MTTISISGVGGTGKTSVAEALVKELNKKNEKGEKSKKSKSREQKYKLVVLNRLAERLKAYSGYDKARQSKIVNMDKLKTELKKLSKKYENIVIEGHFAHDFPADIVIVLRCEPSVLEKRLRKKYNWPTKITENLEAEMISLISEEAILKHRPGTVFEIDTTRLTAGQTAKIIEKIVKNEDNERLNRFAGKIDWLKFR